MNAKLEPVVWLADRNVLFLDRGELLYRVPSTGIDCTRIKEMADHQAEPRGASDVHAHEQTIPPHLTANSVLTQSVHHRFEVYAQLNPGAGAVKFDRTKLTYGELDSQADGLAVLLQQNGLGRGDICAVCMTPSIAMVRAMLAVLKAGGSYLLLDPALPSEHLAAVLGTSKPAIVIMRKNFSDRLVSTNAHIIFCGEDCADLPYAWPQEYPTRCLSPAYATVSFPAADGPHFAFVTHRAFIDRLESAQEFSPIRQGDSFLQCTNCALKTLAWEFLWPLSHGAQLVIPFPETDPERMRELIARESITVMHVEPSLLHLLLAGSCQNELRSLRALSYASDPPTGANGAVPQP